MVMPNKKGFFVVASVTFTLFFFILFLRTQVFISPGSNTSRGKTLVKEQHNVSRDMHYWKGDSADFDYWPKPQLADRYFTFKSWGAGFNNERISLEIAFCFAFLTNRTLV